MEVNEDMMEEMKVSVKVPMDRVGVIIGKNGSTLKELQEKTKTRMSVEENDVLIEGKSLYVWKARDIIRAIARGFSPVRAMRLLKDQYMLDIIDLSEYLPTEKAIKRVKARIIGKNGRTRELIEEHTGVFVSVYGKTVALIGSMEGLDVARRAVEMLIEGSKHSTVYAYLEQNRTV